MDQKQQIAEKLKQATNILVTVSNNPSVDQLAACIGLALALNKLGKHATAVFSGTVPSTLEFLKPEETLEDNIDSLRDFIISLDKAKADKLRYKVEDKVVKIYITPYRTSLSEQDLEFSQGDFNVDAVVALGVQAQSDIDQAIAAHGRILHDATVVTINVAPGGEFGSINWVDSAASSLCELVAGLVEVMDKQAIDSQIATALLTGIVAETNRFSNNKTTPVTMSVSATLMAAGANQQLVITKLETAVTPPESPVPLAPGAESGEINVREEGGQNAAGQQNESVLSIGGGGAEPLQQPAPAPPEPPKSTEETKSDEEAKPISSLEDLAGPDSSQENKEPELARIHIDDQGRLHTVDDKQEDEDRPEPTTDPTRHVGGSRMILHPPSMGGGGLVGEAYSDPLTAPRAPDPMAGGQGDASVPPAPSPFMPPASASIAPPPAPFMPPSMTPGPVGAPAPAASPTDTIPPAGAQSDLAPPAGSPPGATTPPPDLSVPLPADAPLPTAQPNIPAPVGPPPPVPPPMIPNLQ